MEDNSDYEGMKGGNYMWIEGTRLTRIGDQEVSQLNGHPTFGVQWNPVEEKYRIFNLQTGDFTQYVFDEIFFSKERFYTWVEEYIIVRKGKTYYVADNDGNLYFANDFPYAICRNALVHPYFPQTIGQRFQLLNWGQETESIVIHEKDEIPYAFLKRNNLELLLSAEGTEYFSEFGSEKQTFFFYHDEMMDTLNDNYINTKNSVTFFNDSFDRATKIEINDAVVCKVGKWSDTYCIANGKETLYYNRFLDKIASEYMQFRTSIGMRLDYLEIEGDSYFFLDKTTFHKIQGTISKPRDDKAGNIVFRQGTTLYALDMDSFEIARHQLTMQEMYLMMLLEK